MGLRILKFLQKYRSKEESKSCIVGKVGIMGKIVSTFFIICWYLIDNVGNFFSSLRFQPKVVVCGFGNSNNSSKNLYLKKKANPVFMDMLVTWPNCWYLYHMSLNLTNSLFSPPYFRASRELSSLPRIASPFHPLPLTSSSHTTSHT